MTPRRIPLLLIFAILLNTFVPGARPAAQALPAQARFIGTILHAGAAVPGAMVRVRLKDSAAARDVVASTNASGRFTFTNLTPGSAVVIAISGSMTATKFLRLDPGDNTADIDFQEADPPATRERRAEGDGQQRAAVAVPMTTPSATYTAATDAGARPDAAEPAAAPALSPLCTPGYRAEKIDVEFPTAATFGEVVNRLNTNFGANILLDNDVRDIPVQTTLSNAPWTSILNSLFELYDLDKLCLDGGLVAVGKRSKIQQIAEQRRLSAPIETDYIEIKNLLATEGSPVDPSGQSTGTATSTLDTLETQVRELLRASDKRAEFRRVPGTNLFYIAATREQIARAKELIERADLPPYQVYIETLLYTINDTQRRELGGEMSLVVGNGSQTNLGGFTTLPNRGGDSGGGQGSSGINPGGVGGLGDGFSQPAGLAASNPSIVLGGSALFGTAQFSFQYTAAQFKGLLNEQARPTGITMSGQTVRLDSGLQIPIIIPAIVGGSNGSTNGQLRFLEAGIIANITPYVSPDGKVITARVRLEKNSVDTSITVEGGAPGINRNSAQMTLQVADNQTVVIGGLATDSLSNAVTKVPGLGDIPGIGNLFKKRATNEIRSRFYYAIRFKVIPKGQTIPQPQVPSDAKTDFPPAPKAQDPSPYKRKF